MILRYPAQVVRYSITQLKVDKYFHIQLRCYWGNCKCSNCHGKDNIGTRKKECLKLSSLIKSTGQILPVNKQCGNRNSIKGKQIRLYYTSSRRTNDILVNCKVKYGVSDGFSRKFRITFVKTSALQCTLHVSSWNMYMSKLMYCTRSF